MEKINYEQAIEELETIVSKMESGELNLDAITEKLKRAQKLIKLCKDRLTKTDEEIKKILSSDNWCFLCSREDFYDESFGRMRNLV